MTQITSLIFRLERVCNLYGHREMTAVERARWHTMLRAADENELRDAEIITDVYIGEYDTWQATPPRTPVEDTKLLALEDDGIKGALFTQLFLWIHDPAKPKRKPYALPTKQQEFEPKPCSPIFLRALRTFPLDTAKAAP